MKITKLDVAKLLSTTSNVFASQSELVQFFRSPQYHPEEEHIENNIDDFLTFRKQLDADLLELSTWSIEKSFLKGKTFTTSKIPIKIQKQLEREKQELEDYIKNTKLEDL